MQCPHMLSHLDRKIALLFKRRAARFKNVALYVNICAAIGLSVSTCLQFATTDKWASANTAGVISSVVALALTIVLLGFNEDASEELDAAKDAINQVKSKENDLQSADLEIRIFRRAERRARELFISMKDMREIIEQSLEFPSRELADVLESVLGAGERGLRVALGFKTTQHYTLCIYEARQSSEGKALHLIAHDRSPSCDISEARIWPVGIGVAGHCYQANREVIIADANDPSVASLVQHNSKPSDAQLHRSFVAIPIRVGNLHSVWGVVIATNSEPGHFDLANGTGVRTAEAARALAGMVSLTIQARKLIAQNATPAKKPSANQNSAKS